MKKTVLIITLILTIMLPLCAFEVNDVQLHLKITGLTKAAAPEFWRNYLILTYKPVKPARYVGASFSSEDYQMIHTFMVNNHGTYFLVLPIPVKETVDYRLVIDGIWETDPHNPSVIRDRNGLRLSRLQIEKSLQSDPLSPVLMADSRVKFHIRSTPGKQIYLAGDFNRWDPYMTNMKESEPGIYTVTLPLKPGRYGYYYLIDGEPRTDPLNFQKTRTSAGEDVSLLFIPG